MRGKFFCSSPGSNLQSQAQEAISLHWSYQSGRRRAGLNPIPVNSGDTRLSLNHQEWRHCYRGCWWPQPLTISVYRFMRSISRVSSRPMNNKTANWYWETDAYGLNVDAVLLSQTIQTLWLIKYMVCITKQYDWPMSLSDGVVSTRDMENLYRRVCLCLFGDGLWKQPMEVAGKSPFFFKDCQWFLIQVSREIESQIVETLLADNNMVFRCRDFEKSVTIFLQGPLWLSVAKCQMWNKKIM